MTEDRDGGQAATELALVLPLVVLLLLAVVQVALVARDQILVVHGARAAAREASVDSRPSSVRSAALRATGLKPTSLRTETSAEGGVSGMVTVWVEYRSPTEVMLIGPLLPDIPLGAKAAMRLEPGHGAEKILPEGKKTAGTTS